MKRAAEVRYVERVPTVAEFRALRLDAEWKLPPDAAMERALSGTLYAVCAEDGQGKAVGTARVVGDGGVQFFVTDVIVHHDWRGSGIGSEMMRRILGYIRAHASPEAFVGLFAAHGRQGFYERLGFIARPTETLGPGMMYVRHGQGGSGGRPGDC